MILTDGQQESGDEVRYLISEIAAGTARLAGFFGSDPASPGTEKIKRINQLVLDIAGTEGEKAGFSVFPVMKLLSQLNRLANSLRGQEAESAGQAAAQVIRASRALVEHVGKKLSRAFPAGNLGRGEILPAAKLELAKPGKILLALEAAVADSVAEILKRFGHSVTVAQTADDVFSAFGFSRAGSPERPPAFSPSGTAARIWSSIRSNGLPWTIALSMTIFRMSLSATCFRPASPALNFRNC